MKQILQIQFPQFIWVSVGNLTKHFSGRGLLHCPCEAFFFIKPVTLFKHKVPFHRQQQTYNKILNNHIVSLQLFFL